MQTLITLLCLQFLIVFVVDYSGAVEQMLTPIARKLTGSKTGKLGKPWTCSLCMNFWAGLLYLIFSGAFNIGWLAMVAWLSILTPVTLDLIWTVRDTFTAIFQWFKNENGIG